MAPCILYNLDGYYDVLKNLLDHMVKMDLADPANLTGIKFAKNLDEIKEMLGL